MVRMVLRRDIVSFVWSWGSVEGFLLGEMFCVRSGGGGGRRFFFLFLWEVLSVDIVQRGCLCVFDAGHASVCVFI